LCNGEVGECSTLEDISKGALEVDSIKGGGRKIMKYEIWRNGED